MNSEEMDEGKNRIAIIGMAGKFPGAKNIEQFWDNLQNGIESIRFFSDNELKDQGIPDKLLKDPDYVKANGVLDDVELFDADFFSFTPREAEITDPQHRVFLECAWDALENAGYRSDQFDGKISLFGGCGLSTYLLNNLLHNPKLPENVTQFQLLMGNNKDYAMTRTSYKLDLRGPSVNVNTACSSSLIAVHLAAQSLIDYESDMALAGGVGIQVPMEQGYIYQENSINSPDGHCRAFDARANGTVGGNGAGVIVMKRLEDALKDGDEIDAILLGSALNNDGANKAGYTAPSVEGQAEVIAEALAISEADPETIQFIETHGTGTKLGDPIEMTALDIAFREKTTKKNFCALGSVKTNIGHLDEAAGIAGLIKTVLSLKNKMIPPSLHYTSPNPEINFKDSCFFVNAELKKWETDGSPRRAGISSFGIGGTNAHLILEEAPEVIQNKESNQAQIILLSAKTETACQKASENLAGHFEKHPEIHLENAAFTLQKGRKAFPCRRAFVCLDLNDAIQKLRAPQDPPVMTEDLSNGIVFLFPGQGSQYPDMGKGIYETEPVFKEQMDLCDEILRPLIKPSLIELLYGDKKTEDERAERLKETRFTQPAIFAIEYSLARLWMHWGIMPKAMMGHSIGEYTAACLAGVISLKDALTLTADRGKMIQERPSGAMLSVSLSQENLLPFLSKSLEFAAINAPNLTVITGETEEIEALHTRLISENIQCQGLHTSHAFHSKMMDSIVSDFEDRVKKIELKAPQIPFISNLSGDWIKDHEAQNPSYWARHLRNTVLFSQGIATLKKHSFRFFLEAGPGNALRSFVSRHKTKEFSPLIFNSLRHAKEKTSDWEYLLDTLAALWKSGAQPNWDALHGNKKAKRIHLPSYPYQRKRYWIDAPRKKSVPAAPEEKHKADISNWFYAPMWKEKEISETKNSDISMDDCLVFCHDDEFTEELLRQLREIFSTVTQIKAGEDFKKENDSCFQINPKEKDHYELILKNIPNAKHILHLWNLSGDASEPENGKKALDQGLRCLLYLSQALGDLSLDSKVQIHVFTPPIHSVTGKESLHPFSSTLLGPVKVIPQEYPDIECRLIDLDLSEERKTILSAILGEIQADSKDNLAVWRGKTRWIQSIKPLAKGNKKTVLKDGGVYLITGGLGSMGLAFAKYIANQVHCKLILSSRSSLPKREQRDVLSKQNQKTKAIIQSIIEIEKSGSEVLIERNDFSKEKETEEFFKRVIKGEKQLQGVIHCAGVLGQGMIQRKDWNEVEAVLAPKVMGSLHLARQIEKLNPDFFILCSSLSSLNPIVGQADYAAANAFLDCFAHDYQKKHSTFTVSIDWGFWQELGIIENTENYLGSKEQVLEEIKSRGLENAGVDSFAHILNFLNAAQVIVSPEKISSPPSHPWFSRRVLEAQGVHSLSGKMSAAACWALDEHRILGKIILPGTAYLELARAAYEEITGEIRAALSEVYFLKPLILESDEEREVKTILKERGEGFDFYIVSKIGDREWIEHTRGEIAPFKDTEPRKKWNQELIPCSEKNDEAESDFEKAMKSFGPRWHNLLEAKFSDKESIALLKIPAAFEKEHKIFKLHPALLDNATGYLSVKQCVQNGLPFSYGSIKIMAPLSGKIYSHIKTKTKESDGVTAYDINISDSQGKALIEIQNFQIKEVQISNAKKEDDENLALAISSPGSLDSLSFIPEARKNPGAEEIEIEIHSAGLNFIEVLFALDMLPRPEGGKFPFGLECAGVVARVGSNVKDFQAGDEVLAYTNGCIRFFTTLPASRAAHKPKHLSMDQAAAIPAAYMTAYESLVRMARLEKGEKVLIHSAAGGVGQAAVNIAQWIGAEIFATAGTEEKRDFLSSLGIKHIMNSRNLDFARQIMDDTQGKGIQVVLNSLGGEFLIKSLSVLGQYGRFIELGKRDIFQNNSLPLGHFSKKLSFMAVDVGPDLPHFSQTWNDLIARVNSKDLPPLPVKTFKACDVISGFEYMAAAKHIGKIVFQMNAREAVRNSSLWRKSQGRTIAEIVGFNDEKEDEEIKPIQKKFSHQSDLSATEQSIAKIWEELLGTQEISSEDNFFKLNGDSLLAAQVISKIHRALGVKLPMSSIFDHPTVRELAKTVDDHKTAPAAAPEKELSEDEEEGSI